MNLTFANETIASWNGWFLDETASNLLYDFNVRDNPSFYYVELTRIKSVEDIDKWCSHIEQKEWGTHKCIQGLRKALYGIFYADIVQRRMFDKCQSIPLANLHEQLRTQLIEAESSFERLKRYVKLYERYEGLENLSEVWESWLDIKVAIGHAATVHSADTLNIRKTLNEMDKLLEIVGDHGDA